MCKFSIIIPAYNAEKYIEKCIDSILSQDYNDFEIIIIDDGSVDNTYNLINDIGNKDKRVRIFHKENGGVSSARNVGIQNAQGKYILFVDSDDWIEHNCLSKINTVINENSSSQMYLFSNANKIYSNKECNIDEIISYLISTEKINSPCNKVYLNSIIKDTKLLFDRNVEIGEDLLFNINYIQYIEKVYVSSYKYYCYNRDNANSLTQKYKKDKYKELMYVNDNIKRILNKYKNEEIENAINYIRVKNFFSCIMDLSHKDCKYTFKKKMRCIKEMKDNNSYRIKGILKLFEYCPNILIYYLAKCMYFLKIKKYRI